MDDLRRQLLDMPVYRSRYIRYVRKGQGLRLKEYPAEQLDIVHLKYDESFRDDHFLELVKSNVNNVKIYYDYPRLGVIYYKDIQNFHKRLKQNLLRNYGINEHYQCFNCAELGPNTHRPHFHILIRVPKKLEKVYRAAIIKSWPFASYKRTAKYIQIARNAASYCASYVNSSADLPKFFKKNFKQKHSYSHDFGMANPHFSLDSIRQKADRGDMSFPRSIKRDGKECIVNVPIPKYVVNRYFPEFKGLSRLTSDQMEQCLLQPEKLRGFKYELGLTDDDLHKIFVRQNHALHLYSLLRTDLLSVFSGDCQSVPISDGRFVHTGHMKLHSETYLYEYVRDYVRVWRCLRSTQKRLLYESVTDVVQWTNFYENAKDYLDKNLRSFSLDELGITGVSWCLDPNEQDWRVAQTNYYDELYNKLCKERAVVNCAMSSCGHDV